MSIGKMAIAHGLELERVRLWLASRFPLPVACRVASRWFRRALTVFIVILILARLGKLAILRPAAARQQVVARSASELHWQMDRAMAESLREARSAAEGSARELLQPWVAQFKSRVEPGFLDWYFSYFTQQAIGLRGLLSGLSSMVFASRASAAEPAVQGFQEEFAARVLRPELAQLALERIRDQVLLRYIEQLRASLAAVPYRYAIAETDWDRHLQTLGRIGGRTNASRQVPLDIKALVGTGGMAGLLAAKKVLAAPVALGAKLGAKTVGSAAEQVVAKTGAKVAAKFGAEALGAIVSVGIVVWDLWDHQKTVEEQRPILRASLLEYIDAIGEDALSNPATGLLAVIETVERAILAGSENRTW